MKSGIITEWTWAAALMLFRCFCLAWLAIVVLILARGVVIFLR